MTRIQINGFPKPTQEPTACPRQIPGVWSVEDLTSSRWWGGVLFLERRLRPVGASQSSSKGSKPQALCLQQDPVLEIQQPYFKTPNIPKLRELK